MASDTLPKISSLAAPTEEEIGLLRSLSPEERADLIAVHLARGQADIDAGRYTDVRSETELSDYLDRVFLAP